jgi:hypothetical protein
MPVEAPVISAIPLVLVALICLLLCLDPAGRPTGDLDLQGHVSNVI